MKYGLLLWFSFLAILAQAQVPGTLDTTFRIRTNYGPNRFPETICQGRDGSLYLHSPTALFSGRKTGPLMKIKPDGTLDTTFNTPVFYFGTVGWCIWAVSEGYGYFEPSPNGSVYCIHSGTLYSGDSVYNTIVRFLPSGEIDPAFCHSDFASTYNFIGIAGNGKIMGSRSTVNSIFPGSVRIQCFLPNGAVDTSFHFTDSTARLVGSVTSKNGNMVFLFRHGYDTTVYYRRYEPESNTLSPKFGFDEYHYGSGTGLRYHDLIGLTKYGSILERVYNPPGFYGQSFIRRKKPDGTIDTSYHMLAFPYHERFEISESGEISFMKGIYTDTLTIYRYDSLGFFKDSVRQRKILFRFVNQDTILEAGPDSNNRWSYVKKSAAGATLLNLSTRNGFNGMVSKVRMDAEKRVIAAGNFTEYDSHKSAGLIRLLPSGAPDTSFTCTAFPRGISSKVVLLDRFANGDFLLVTGQPEGVNKRYLHRIRPDGSPDTSFCQTNLSDFPYTEKEITSAILLSSGKIWLGLLAEFSPVYFVHPIVRLNSDGSKDPTFTPFNPITTQNDYGFVKDFQSVDSAYTLVNLRVLHSTPSGDESMLSCGLLPNQSMAGEGYSVFARVPDYTQSGKIALDEDKVLISGEGVSRRYWLSGAEDLDFRPRQWNGLNLSNWPNPELVLQSGDILASDKPFVYYETQYFPKRHLFKLNGDGVLDTSFVTTFFNGEIANALEADSQHLYVVGDVVQFGNQPVNYIFRMHNAPASIPVSKATPVSKIQISLFPNPTQGNVTVAGGNGQGRISFFNSLGQKFGTFPLSKGAINVKDWPQGIYHWILTGGDGNGATGRLSKE